MGSFFAELVQSKKHWTFEHLRTRRTLRTRRRRLTHTKYSTVRTHPGTLPTLPIPSNNLYTAFIVGVDRVSSPVRLDESCTFNIKAICYICYKHIKYHNRTVHTFQNNSLMFSVHFLNWNITALNSGDSTALNSIQQPDSLVNSTAFADGVRRPCGLLKTWLRCFSGMVVQYIHCSTKYLYSVVLLP